MCIKNLYDYLLFLIRIVINQEKFDENSFD